MNEDLTCTECGSELGPVLSLEGARLCMNVWCAERHEI